MRTLFYYACIVYFLIFATVFVNASEVDQEVINKLSMLSKVTGCGFTITSGHRSIKHNKKVGGARNSYHLSGKAVDVTIDKGCRKGILEVLVESVSYFNGIILYTTHIHFDIGDRIYLNIGHGDD